MIPFGEGAEELGHKPRLRGSIRELPQRLVQRNGAVHAWVLAEAA
jgi:hypothetical protein